MSEDTPVSGIPTDETSSSPSSRPASGRDKGKKGGKSRTRKPLLWLTATAVVALAAGYASLPWWVHSVPSARGLLPASVAAGGSGGASSGDVAQLRDEVARLSEALGGNRQGLRDLGARVQKLEQGTTPAPADQDAEKLASVDKSLNTLGGAASQALGEQMAGLRKEVETMMASRAPASSLLALSERLSVAEGQIRQVYSRQDRAVAFLLAVGQLRQAIDTGRPFEGELRTLRAVTPAGVDAQTLTSGFAAAAGRGVATPTLLQQGFAAIGSQVVRASALPDENASWVTATFDRMLALVTVRRTDGEAVGNDAAAVVSRAEALLNSGSLAGAVMEMSRLDGGAATVAAAWQSSARERLAADQGLADLTSEALSALSAAQADSLPDVQPAAPAAARPVVPPAAASPAPVSPVQAPASPAAGAPVNEGQPASPAASSGQ